MDKPVAFLVARAHGSKLHPEKEVVLTPITDDIYMEEGDEAIPLYAAHPSASERNDSTRAALELVMVYPDIRAYLGSEITQIVERALKQPAAQQELWGTKEHGTGPFSYDEPTEQEQKTAALHSPTHPASAAGINSLTGASVAAAATERRNGHRRVKKDADKGTLRARRNGWVVDRRASYKSQSKPDSRVTLTRDVVELIRPVLVKYWESAGHWANRPNELCDQALAAIDLEKESALLIWRIRDLEAKLINEQRENKSLRAECGVRQIKGYIEGKTDRAEAAQPITEAQVEAIVQRAATGMQYPERSDIKGVVRGACYEALALVGTKVVP